MTQADAPVLGEPQAPPRVLSQPALVSLGVGGAVFLLGTGAESLIISAVRVFVHTRGISMENGS